MQSLDAIKRRIKIVNTTAKITGAMKLVAIAKVKKQSTEFKVVSDFCQDFYPILDDLASGVIQKSIYPTTNSNKSL
jgi:F-type H+-transporting ATPase subunit gamma